MKDFETKLTDPKQEQAFQRWITEQAKLGHIQPGDARYYKSNGFGYDYDFRGAFAGKVQPKNGYWPDTYKKPNHNTFSNESVYAKVPGVKPGSWNGNTFVPYREPAKRSNPLEYKPQSSWRPSSISNTPLVVDGSEVKPDKVNGLVQPRNLGLFQIMKKLTDIRGELIPQDELPASEGGPTIQTSGSNG